jgi:methyltransferase (TIGR00027 family)
MPERAASSTAVLVCQGRAVADGRYAVGRFADPVARELLDPPERAVVDRARADQPPEHAGERMGYEMVRRTGWLMVPRTVAIDEAVRASAAGQVVILGAGLDARAWRMAELADATVFEVDHAASQHDKLRRVGDLAPKARRLVPVEVDLGRQRLALALESAGFDRQARSTWVWEGVVPYLTPAEVRATVAQLAELSAPGSRLVVNYQVKSRVTTVMRTLMRLVWRIARQPDPFGREPWRSRWQPEEMRALLGDLGFAVTTDQDLLTLARGLDLPPEGSSSLRNGRVAVAERR